MTMKLIMYGGVLLLSMNLYYWWWLWISMELMVWLLMSMMMNYLIMMIFMIWQSVSMMLTILLIVAFNKPFLIFIMLIFKMSLLPFYYLIWIIHFMCKWKITCIFMFVHKYPSMLLLASFMSKITLALLMMFSWLGVILMWNEFSLMSTIVNLTLIDSVWMLISGVVSLKIMLGYFLWNFIFMTFIYSLPKIMNSLSLLFYFLMLFSLPPLLTFYIKVVLLSMIKVKFALVLLLLYLVVLMIYWSQFYSKMMFKSFLFKVDLMYKILIVNMIWGCVL